MNNTRSQKLRSCKQRVKAHIKTNKPKTLTTTLNGLGDYTTPIIQILFNIPDGKSTMIPFFPQRMGDLKHSQDRSQ